MQRHIIIEGGDDLIRTQISLDAELYERAKLLAQQKGISFAELCRRCLADSVAEVPGDKPWVAFAGTVDGNRDDSRSVDEVVYGRDRA